jgi:hypothetical protein
MKEEIQALFPSRTQHSSPEYEDWQTVLDLATFVFLLNRDAPLYTAYRGAINLRPTVSTTIAALQSMYDLAPDRAEAATTVDTTALNAARRTLEGLGDVMVDRGVGTSSSETLQKFNDQLDKSLDTMKAGVGTNVSPEEAKTALLEQLAQFKLLEVQTDTKTALLENALTTYLGLHLRGSGLADIAERSERVIRDIQEEAILGTTPLKASIDQLIAIQSTMGALSQIGAPELTIVSGTGSAAGTGTAASVTCGKSGPWDLDASGAGIDELDLVVDGAALSTITLPTGTKAQAQTAIAPAVGGLTPAPTSGLAWALRCTVNSGISSFKMNVRVDDGTATQYTVPLRYAAGGFPKTPYLAFDSIDAIYGGTADVTKTNPSAGVVHIERDEVGYTHSFRNSAATFAVVTGASNALEDIGLLDSGEYGTAVDKAYRGTSVGAEALASYLRANVPQLNPEAVYTELVSGDYGDIDSATTINLWKVLAVDLSVVSGSRIVTSPTVNFVGLGVLVGDMIGFDSQIFTLVAVSEDSLTIDGDHTSATGTYPFVIAPAAAVTDVVAGDYLEVTSATLGFTAYHKVVSALNATLTIEDGFIDAGRAEFRLFRELLTLKSKKLDTSSAIEVDSGSTANTEFDFPTVEQRGTVDQWSAAGADFSTYSILEDDLLRISSDVAIESVGADLTLKEEITNNISTSYSVVNPDRESFDTFKAALTSWRATNLSYSRVLDEALNFIVQGHPLPDAITSFQAKVANIQAAYQTLLGYINSFSARRIIAIDDAFKLLLENGYDRGRDLLIACDFETFFALEAEEATYEGHFQMETQDFAQNYVAGDPYVDPRDTELQDYVRPDLESTDLGLDSSE